MRRSVDGAALVSLALMILLLPFRWIAAWFTAAAVHEGCHILAVRLFGGRTVGFSAGVGGARIEAADVGPRGRLWCALAGPAGSLMLVLLFPRFPLVAVCGALQAAWNLLPIYPLDGGKALRCILDRFANGADVERGVAAVVTILIWAGAFYCCFALKMGILPMLGALTVLLKTNFGKIPCKRRQY